MVDHRGVARLLLAGRTYREIVAAAKVSQRDVARVKRVIEEHGLTTASLDRVTDADLAALFPDGRARVSAGYDAPDFRGVVASMKRNRHYTVLAAWRRYVEVPAAGRKYGDAQYCHLFSEYVAGNDLVATLRHVHDWFAGTPAGDWTSAGLWATGEHYGVPQGIVCSFPVTSDSTGWTVVEGLAHGPLAQSLIRASVAELVEERESVRALGLI